jgi:5-methylcytosine-specific restriction endonuclease McrBC regulatory subunit McrC
MPDDALRIIELHEREARLFSRSDFFDQLGQSLILPETRALSAIDLRDVIDGIQLRALGLIGYLPVTNKIALNLKPKFPMANLWHMLNIADETYERILPVLRSYEATEESAPHLLLARGFCHYLGKILTAGVARGYYQEAYEGHFRPKVEFGKTMARYVSRANEVYTASNVFTFSANSRPNGILKSACIKVLQIIPRNKFWENERKLLGEALYALESVDPKQMTFADLDLADRISMRVREHYRGALNVYSVMMGFTNIGFSYSATGKEMPSFLFNLDSIFESFVRNTLRQGLREDGISIVDGNIHRHQGSLFRDTKKFPIKPDIIFRRDKAVRAIGEVKYKPKIDDSDRYQVISHAVALGSPIGIWISPALSNEEAGLEYVGLISGGTKFYHYRLNISSGLKEACGSMVKKLFDLIGTP